MFYSHGFFLSDVIKSTIESNVFFPFYLLVLFKARFFKDVFSWTPREMCALSTCSQIFLEEKRRAEEYFFSFYVRVGQTPICVKSVNTDTSKTNAFIFSFIEAEVMLICINVNKLVLWQRHFDKERCRTKRQIYLSIYLSQSVLFPPSLTGVGIK